ncbi:hypothetical protein SBV1_2970008 [Verrucomicrobia bacterium]|nr:hypothetical protein SBV1_2970008 [Verrucomicrobiota bacterium]
MADELRLANLGPQIAACQNRFYPNNSIDVVVVGRFKAGKSSFLDHLVEKNLSRPAADWQDRIRAGIEELRSQAEQYALNELATLEEMLARSHSDEPRLKETVQALDDYRLELARG